MLRNLDVLYYETYNLENIITPMNPDKLQQLLTKAAYNEDEIHYLIRGFREGFKLNYQGPCNRRDRSSNIPFTIGDATEMWNKVMKEVKEKCYAGPYDNIPFEHFIQSPIGLVPKAGGKTRLIFHLSYDF